MKTKLEQVSDTLNDIIFLTFQLGIISGIVGGVLYAVWLIL